MPIDAFLNEATWKSAGLTKRTTMEKLKFKKTGVSESLRAYAGVGNLGIDRGPDKQARLKSIKTVLTKCKADHRTNGAFVAYIDNVEKGVVREASRINKEVDALTLDSIMGDAAAYPLFHAYCTNTEHNPEPLEFLHDVRANMAAPALINTYVRAGSPKEVNIDDNIRQAWIAAPALPGPKQAIVNVVAALIRSNELKRYIVKMKVTL
jgi:hypothetical protein